jgi:putative ABC transport system permease protein
MTRLVSKQRLQIGTLKALGFKKRKITAHYIGYGFWVSLLGAICGVLAGRYFVGAVFMGMEMDYFEVPDGVPIVEWSNYVVAALAVVCVSLITYLTCRKELGKSASESLRSQQPSVKGSSYKITAKGFLNRLNFSSKWNLRDMLRNKLRTFTGIVGVTCCCMLIVCALGMLNSMNHFIDLQYGGLYNFDYELSLKGNISDDRLDQLEDKYGSATSESLGIEIKDDEGNRNQNNAFVTDAGDYVRFQDNNDRFIELDRDDGVYMTYKLAELDGYELGDTVVWHIYGDDTYYESEIVGFNKDPQNQNISMTRGYL